MPPISDENDDNGNSWNSYRRFVVQSLKQTDVKLSEIQKDIVSLKIRAAMWGFLAGIVSACLPVAVEIILKLAESKK